MGEVYLAEDRSLGREVAIKVLPARSAHQPIHLERFTREASAIGALNHPNIVTIHAVEEIQGLRLIVMERVEGRNLATFLPAGGLTPEQFFAIGLPLAEAVAAAHKRGIIHRDLKPANVMVTHDQRVKVVDFGLAKLRTDVPQTGAGFQPTLTQAGHLVGTLTYMSPEQLRGEAADARSDVFALGTVLYEMATGRHPFDGDTQPVVISSILCQEPAPVSRMRAELPDQLSEIIGRCLAKDPADRYPDAQGVHKELAGLARDLDALRILQQAKSPRSRWTRWGAVAVATVAVAGAALWWRGRPEAPGTASMTVPTVAAATPIGTASVAVLHFQNARKDPAMDWLRSGLSDMLVTDLSQSRAIRVVPADRTYAALRTADALQPEDVLSTDQLATLAADLGAQTLVTGSFVQLQDQLSITFRVHSMPAAEVIATDRLLGSGEASLFTLVDQLSQQIRTHLEIGNTAGQADRAVEAVSTASIEAYRSYVEGRNLRLGGKLSEAAPLLEKAVELDPGFAMAWARLTVVYRALGRETDSWRAADRAYANADRLPPRERAFVEGQYLGNRRDRAFDAIEAYRRVLEIDPDDQTARFNLASLLSFHEQTDAAIEQLEILRQNQSDMIGPYMFLAHEYAVHGDFERGLEIHEAAARFQPQMHWRHLTHGWHLSMMGRFDEARAAHDRAEALRPGDSFSTIARWHNGMLAENWQEAVAAAEAGRAAPDAMGRANGVHHLALTRLIQGQEREAVALLAEYATINPSDPRFVANGNVIAAELLLQLDRPREALALASAARRDADEDWSGWRARFLIALAHQAMGDTDAADRSAAEIDPEFSTIDRRYRRHLDGRLALARGDIDEAREALTQAASLLLPRGISWQLFPDHVPIWSALGATEAVAGNFEAAIDWYQRAADSTTERVEHPLLWVRSFYHLGRLHAERGDAEASRAAYRRFLGLWADGEIDREAVEEARRAAR